MTADRDQSPNLNSDAADWVTVGEITGAFGIRGELKVRPLSDFTERFAPGAILYLGEKRERRVVSASRTQGTQIILALDELTTASDAERLRGKTLAIRGDQIATPAAGQFFQHDIIGLRVERMDGRALGVITDILPGAASDLYVVRDAATGEERLLPAVREFIREVDVDAGVMRVSPIPGLFDDDADEAR